MFELLNSNYLPVKTTCRTFEEIFFKSLEQASEVTIASGYISEDSIADLIGLYKSGLSVKLKLIIGMHFFDGFTYGQYKAVKKLSSLLREKQQGEVFLAASVKYHGKVYLFSDLSGKKTAVIGSSNLTKISSIDRIYDTDLFFDEQSVINQVEILLQDLEKKNCESVEAISIDKIKIIKKNDLFENYLSVEKASIEELADIKNSLTSISFDIPLKAEKKSNLNCYFGRGRKNFQDGSILPRPWYEVELIVPKEITTKRFYPQKNEIFKVITDDGYIFNCKTSGDFSKNFRSADDLCILGRWLKGRLENSKVLSVGNCVEEETFIEYGRQNVSLIKTTKPDYWYLDFGVR